jgi:hypothetical protein
MSSPGGIVARYDGRGSCQRNYDAGWGVGYWTFRGAGTETYTQSLGPDYFRRTTRYNKKGTSNYTTEEKFCFELVWADYENKPQPPSIWDKIPTSIDMMYNLFRTKETKQRPPEFRIKTPVDAGGVRGKLIGFGLFENSPDGAVGEVVLTQAEIDAGEKVFVLVDSKGDEDWLEFGVLGGQDGGGSLTNRVVFKQPLADFETNQWYEIQIPASFLVPGTNTYTYFLNSAGGTNSSVFFATGTIEDLAPTVSHLALTNNFIALGVSNLVEGYSYSLEQTADSLTNWQQAVSFTASNQVETLSLPMTNSSMFYRIALPVP